MDTCHSFRTLRREGRAPVRCDAVTLVVDAYTNWVAREELRSSEASRAVWLRGPGRPTRIDRLATALRGLAHEDARDASAGEPR